MNRNSLILGLAIVAAAGAASAESYQEYNTPFVSTASRTAVRVEAQGARTGANPWSITYNPLAQLRSAKTRAQVSAEFIAERSRVAAFTGEDSGSAYLASNRPAAGGAVVAGRPANGQ